MTKIILSRPSTKSISEGKNFHHTSLYCITVAKNFLSDAEKVTVIILLGLFSTIATAQSPKLAMNDISYLWPVPSTKTEVDQLINGESVWPKPAFDAVMDMALKVTARDSGKKPNLHRIQFKGRTNTDFRQLATWKVVGFRVDPSAPSTQESMIKSFGSIPQIRLIMQPVTVDSSGEVTVHDFTAHVAFDYVLKNTHPRTSPFEPDRDKFSLILTDLLELKEFLLNATPAVSTDGQISIHPGLAGKTDGFPNKIRSFLDKHLAQGTLNIISFMGLAPRPEPWVFFNMTVNPIQTDIAKGQMQFMFDSDRPASPPTKPNSNIAPGVGVSTAILFEPKAQQKLDQPATATQTTPLIKDIPDIIANPMMSNVLNTDCISCHTETTRRKILGIGKTNFAFELPPGNPGVDKTLLPTNDWNLRNFGWFASITMPAKATVTKRTANEIADALLFIQDNYSNNCH